MIDNIGIWVELVMVLGGVLAFGGWQIYATNRDQRRSRERAEAAKKEAAVESERASDQEVKP
jgi:flagellar biosynthesis component FlhA